MLRSSIDLGTNTCLLLIADYDGVNPGSLKVLGDYSTIVRLGEGVDVARCLKQEAIERTLSCLKKYKDHVIQAGLSPENTLCLATSQARDAKNGADFFKTVQKETGFQFRIISGDEEARLTHLGGLLPGMDPKKSAVIDIGGGSTEIISSQGGQSLDIGSVRFTERYLKSDPVTDQEFENCKAAIDSEVNHLQAWRKSSDPQLQLVAVAGTATTLAAWHLGLEKFNAARIDQVSLSVQDIHHLVLELKKRSVQQRCQLAGVEEKRADVLLAGAMILWRAMECLQFPNCRISTRGIRFGAVLATR